MRTEFDVSKPVTGFRVLALVLCFFQLSQCAYHPPVETSIKPRSYYAHRQTLGGLTAVCEPYLDPATGELVFGANLTGAGYLPVEVILFNESASAYDLSGLRVDLRDEQMRVVRRVDVGEAAGKVKRFMVKRSFLWAVFGTLFLFLILPFALGGGWDAYRANKSVRKTLAARLAMPARLEAGKHVHFVAVFDVSDQGKYDPAPDDDFILELSGIHPEPAAGAPAEDMHEINFTVGFRA